MLKTKKLFNFFRFLEVNVYLSVFNSKIKIKFKNGFKDITTVKNYCRSTLNVFSFRKLKMITKAF